LKIERADQHIRELEARLKSFVEDDPYEAVEKKEPDTGDRIWVVKVKSDPPPRLSIVLGDAVHNLRSALDHLACALVTAEAGASAVHRATAFPISDTAEKCEASLTNVQAAGKDALDLMRASKAYKGGNDALWALRELDDRDKHHLLITVGAAYQSVGIDMAKFLTNLHPGAPALPPMPVFLAPLDRQFPLENDDELFRIPANAPGGEHHPDPQFIFQVALGEPDVFEGAPLLETVTNLRDVVAELVEQFAPLLTA
jgi:hypothetical protein